MIGLICYEVSYQYFFLALTYFITDKRSILNHDEIKNLLVKY